MRTLCCLSLLATISSLLSCQPQSTTHMDQGFILAGTIYTANDQKPVVEAVVMRDGLIIDIGSYADMRDKYPGLTANQTGKPIYPGFIDAHCHFLRYGQSLFNADLVGTKSFDEVVERVEEHYKAFPSEWIMGRGWDQNDWEIMEFPTREKLDERFPDVPVYLKRIDGHAALVNQKALDIIGIAEDYDFNPNLLMRKNGKLTGVLIDEAMEINAPYLPVPDKETEFEWLLASQKNCLAVGLTSVMDCGLKRSSIENINELHQNGSLLMHINAMVEASDTASLEHFIRAGHFVTDRLNVRSVKFYSDGALGSRGACLLEPYSDDADNSGALIYDPDYLRENYKRLHDAGWQVCTHAIGDRAARLILDLYAELLEANNDRRWRIEHAQVVHPDDVDKFGAFNIIPSMQSTHATSDMYWAEDRLGEERVRSAYALRSLMEQNGFLPNGSDFPVEHINPLLGFYAAVARQDTSGYPSEGFQMENALSREEALKAMTIWAAYANFDESNRGSIEIGKQADFVMLDRDIMKVYLEEIPSVRFLTTYIKGKPVYSGL